MAYKISQEFPTASLDITKDFHILHSAYVYICYSILKQSKQKYYPPPPPPHTHTHTTSNNYKQKATGHVTSLANGHFTGSEAPFVCEIPTASSNIYRYILPTLDSWLWGRPAQALLHRRNVSSVRVSLANGTKRTPSQNWGNQLSELHVPHRQCLAGISNAFSASFTSIWPSFPRFYCTPTKRAYSALHPQALTECSPLDFRSSSIKTDSSALSVTYHRYIYK